MAKWSNMTNVTFDEIKPGASADLTRTLSQTDIEVLALVSGDVDPFHIKANGAADSRRDANTIEAAGAEALVAAVLGTKLPGPGMKILRENLKFRGRTSVGDKLTATVTAREKHREGAEVVFDCSCVNQAGDELVAGTVTVAAPTKRVSYAEVVPPELVLRRGDTFRSDIQGMRKIAGRNVCRRSSVRSRLAARSDRIGQAWTDYAGAYRARGKNSVRRQGGRRRSRLHIRSCPCRTATLRQQRPWRWLVPARSRR